MKSQILNSEQYEYNSWIVTLDVLKLCRIVRTIFINQRWIVTLDVLKYRFKKVHAARRKSWIVTLDVLK